MRQLPSAILAAAVALAFATVAQSAVVAAPGSASVATQGTFVTNSPKRTTAASAKPTTQTPADADKSVEVVKPTGVTDVDVRDQQTRDATADTHSSGSTSATANLGTGTATATTPGTTTGTTTGSLAGTITRTVGGAVVITPIFNNPVDANGNAIAPGTLAANQGIAASDVLAGSSVADNTFAVSPAQTNGVSVDRAIAQVSRDRKRVGRNGQLLYSIAPRTNVDRSGQMPDDAPSPALTGSASTLTR